MLYGGSLSSNMRSRDEMSIECCDINLDHRLPTSARGSVATAAARLAEMGVQPGRYSGVEQLFAGGPSCMAVAIERAVLLADGNVLTASDLRLGELSTTQPSGDASPVVKIPPTGIALEEIERQALIEALKMSNWVQKDAAELLNISPRVMNYKIKTLAIEYPRGRRMVDVA